MRGRTFECEFRDTPKMWVSDGCRGIFECGVQRLRCGYMGQGKLRVWCACKSGSSVMWEGGTSPSSFISWDDVPRHARRREFSARRPLDILQLVARNAHVRLHQREAFLQRLADAMAARRVLCTEPCRQQLDASRWPLLRICLSRHVLQASTLCEPWGQSWQQHAYPLRRAWPKGCISVDLSKVARWWLHDARASPPFVESLEEAATLASGKFATAAQPVAEAAQHAAQHRSIPARIRHDLDALLTMSRRSRNISRSRASSRGLSKCSVVGSGTSLRWNTEADGAAIDASDAIFRSNGAQAPGVPGTWLTPRLAGSHTTFRVGCLHNSSPHSLLETCIVPASWWLLPWGGESYNNAIHPCCDTQLRSRMRTRDLLGHARRGLDIAFHRPVSSMVSSEMSSKMSRAVRLAASPNEGSLSAGSDDPSSALLSGWLRASSRSTGGSALLLALSMCKEVDVYGAGLLSLNDSSVICKPLTTPRTEALKEPTYDHTARICP